MSPNELDWGLESGALQLSLAILVDHYGTKIEGIVKATRLYQLFYYTVVCLFEPEGFTLHESFIEPMLAGKEVGNPVADLDRLTRLWSRVEIEQVQGGFIVRAYDDNKHKPTGLPLSYVAQQGFGLTVFDAIAICLVDQDDSRLDAAIQHAELAAIKMQTDADVAKIWEDQPARMHDKGKN